MSYAVSMETDNIDCKIPVSELPKLIEIFETVVIDKKKVSLSLTWEEDLSPIRGKIVGDEIVLNSKQCGTFKNSSSGGLEDLLSTYKGSGIITETGEDDDQEIYKYVKGVRKEGRILFDYFI
jgi:hypothetical protein